MKDRKAKVLLVDDEEGFTKLTQLTLSDYDVRVENDSTRALETARSFKPDLILLDVMMPNLDGGDIAEKIQGDSELSETPIVFLTALVTEKESAKWPGIGGYPFISKPITPERLVENIEKYLKA